MDIPPSPTLDSVSPPSTATGATGNEDPSNFKLNSSKYDFVKVTVWLQDHYYVLSRFIVSRMLTVAQVYYKDAIKIALELKKRLVDSGKLEIRQEELEALLFEIMGKYGYYDKDRDSRRDVSSSSATSMHGDDRVKQKRKSTCIPRYKMMTRFHHKRVPLMVVVFGTGCLGKSTLSTMLGERLHLPNVLQTDIVWDLYSSMQRDKPCKPVWLQRWETREAFMEAYREECATVRHALKGDIEKCFKDGKAIIIEGSHLDPSQMRELIEDVNLAAVGHGTGVSSTASYMEEGEEEEKKKKGIVVPVCLYMKREEHLLFIEQWLASRHERLDFGSEEPLTFEKKLRTLQDNFSAMNDYLMQQVKTTPVLSESESKTVPSSEKGIHMVEVNMHRIEQTIEELHTAVLERIELAFKEGAF